MAIRRRALILFQIKTRYNIRTTLKTARLSAAVINLLIQHAANFICSLQFPVVNVLSENNPLPIRPVLPVLSLARFTVFRAGKQLCFHLI